MSELSLPVPLDAQIAELERELRMRAHVYAKRVAARQMSQRAADQQTAAMMAALETLKGLKPT